MKTLVPVVVCSVLGFAVVFACVPRREPEQLPPTWFELPGRPVCVDGQPTRSWGEVNEALRAATRRYQGTQEFVDGLDSPQLEQQGPGVTIEYLPPDRGLAAGSCGKKVATVIVRPVFPRAVPWSRARQDDLFRYEVERPVGVD